jgi:hypothetical protein
MVINLVKPKSSGCSRKKGVLIHVRSCRLATNRR